MAKKYIINDNEIIAGTVEYHLELLGGRDASQTIGGGKWHVEPEAGRCYFYGSSSGFGNVSKFDFVNAWHKGGCPLPEIPEGCTVLWSEEDTMMEAERAGWTELNLTVRHPEFAYNN